MYKSTIIPLLVKAIRVIVAGYSLWSIHPPVLLFIYKWCFHDPWIGLFRIRYQITIWYNTNQRRYVQRSNVSNYTLGLVYLRDEAALLPTKVHWNIVGQGQLLWVYWYTRPSKSPPEKCAKWNIALLILPSDMIHKQKHIYIHTKYIYTNHCLGWTRAKKWRETTQHGEG